MFQSLYIGTGTNNNNLSLVFFNLGVTVTFLHLKLLNYFETTTKNVTLYRVIIYKI